MMMIVALEFWSVDFKSLWATLLIKIFFYISVDIVYSVKLCVPGDAHHPGCHR